MKPPQRSDPPRITLDTAELEEQIRQRAYALYESRGRQDGHDLNDWLQAEAEILGSKKTALGTRHKELLSQEDTAA